MKQRWPALSCHCCMGFFFFLVGAHTCWLGVGASLAVCDCFVTLACEVLSVRQQVKPCWFESLAVGSEGVVKLMCDFPSRQVLASSARSQEVFWRLQAGCRAPRGKAPVPGGVVGSCERGSGGGRRSGLHRHGGRPGPGGGRAGGRGVRPRLPAPVAPRPTQRRLPRFGALLQGLVLRS